MTDSMIVMFVLIGIFLTVSLVMNIIYYNDRKIYREKYIDLERGIYRYEQNVGHNIYFRKYDYDIENNSFDYSHRHIIFFPDGDIKLTENLYIHKTLLWTSVYSWYYYRKLHKLKNRLVEEHNFRESRRVIESIGYERYMKQQNKLDFKFFRG